MVNAPILKPFRHGACQKDFNFNPTETVIKLNFFQGLTLSMIGPAMLDLQGQTDSDVGKLSKLFIGRGVGYLIGSFASAYLLNGANQSCWISLALALLAASVAVIPWCVNIYLLSGAMVAQGLAIGIERICKFICGILSF